MSDQERVGTDLGREHDAGRALEAIVTAARRRLGYLHIREGVCRYAPLALAMAAASAATRPLLWPSDDGSLGRGLLRAAALGIAASGLVLVVVVARAWRGRPDHLASARRVDDALGLAEVVASGFAFERDRRLDEMALFAIERARRAVANTSIQRVFVAPSRTKTELRRLVGGMAAVVLGLSLGAIDRNVVDRVLHPPTGREVSAAAALKQAAEAAANAPRGLEAEQKTKADEIVEAARRLGGAARGDRKRALDALDDMRKASRALEGEQREQARSLRALRDELEKKSGDAAHGKDGAARPSTTASEALAKLKKELDAAGADQDAARRMLERLDRAAASAATQARAGGADKSGKNASSSGGKSATAAAWSRAAAALKEAREAAARGDTEGAKRAMERAEREIASLEKASTASEGGAMARLADQASELDRSMYAATTGDSSPGRKGGEGEPGRGEGADGTSKQGTNGTGDPSGSPGAGPGGSERAAGPEQRRVKVDGDLQARTDVRAGERAVSAIRGMGRGDDARAYREVFPSYDTVVEDGLREDVVPAARRPAVRRYFSSIRPGSDPDESRK
ncbi:MAG TPA: hypothetical protein VM925_38175 [Labilithrix sp.]|nr:hypothetical protein [Labilithrix sp.]